MNPSRSIVIVGLGPGDVKYLTLEAIDALGRATRIYLRTGKHPIVAALRKQFPKLDIETFDQIFESSQSVEEANGRVAARLLELALEEEIFYGVPGSPSVDETTVQLLGSLGPPNSISIQMINGISYVESVLNAAGNHDSRWLTVTQGNEIGLLADQNGLGEVPGRPGRIVPRTPMPTAPLLVSGISSPQIASSTKTWLRRFWPGDHRVILVRAAGTDAEAVSEMALDEFDQAIVDQQTALFVPAVAPDADVRTFLGLMHVTRTLRAPGGCPWDREQTHQSLKTHLLEESYEVIDALDKKDYSTLVEELGDLMFQITIHSQIAAEHDEFEIGDVIEGITTKLIRRHPHVFGDVDLPTSAAVLQRWETFKQAERPERESILAGIPEAMPALPYSYAVQKRAANVGFEWPDVEALLSKVEEEIREIKEAIAQEEPRTRLMEELGDLSFALVSLGRHLRVDPEEALRRANRKFVSRFRYVEAVCRESGKHLTDLSAGELNLLWERAKAA